MLCFQKRKQSISFKTIPLPCSFLNQPSFFFSFGSAGHHPAQDPPVTTPSKLSPLLVPTQNPAHLLPLPPSPLIAADALEMESWVVWDAGMDEEMVGMLRTASLFGHGREIAGRLMRKGGAEFLLWALLGSREVDVWTLDLGRSWALNAEEGSRARWESGMGAWLRSWDELPWDHPAWITAELARMLGCGGIRAG